MTAAAQSVDMHPMTSGGKIVVFFDLETTGLDTNLCDIIQLGAISGDRSFRAYMLPETAISPGAAAVTGFSVENGRLFRGGEALHTIPLQQALTAFISFLWSLGRPVLLAAHNARRFDVPILTRALYRCSLTCHFQQLGCNFLDTLELSRALYPQLPSRSLVSLVHCFLRRSYPAHDAVHDAAVLQELYGHWAPDHYSVIQCSFSPY